MSLVIAKKAPGRESHREVRGRPLPSFSFHGFSMNAGFGEVVRAQPEPVLSYSLPVRQPWEDMTWEDGGRRTVGESSELRHTLN